MPDVTFTALLQPMHSSARDIRGEIPNRPDSTAAARRASSVDSVFIPSAISSLPLGTHCAPIAVPAERDDDGIWQVYDNAEIQRMGYTQTARRFQAINEKLKGVEPGADQLAR